ncbi:hypothetical protein [Mycobacterium kiyosense]|uniref:Uncharacterized protein n=1 Tax=Mycobacterium kiyosense TaxID=2871094 RepID=A0A9P3Q3T5_9MYCO|nr:hypothetical protein [Mycobacterium kiyosense]BDE11692.1 hypothetical protein MKCMC460_05520 [Mycobacterium sp. 20KCMC460]BDB39839.1 hypothetical protein IWGMT90018_02850 [Mycobacterium kiyosense]GLB81970.1 hypothetical protein SRL2020028_12260 [Mycobacterium kiyosense]GLB88070.1 hypothetical protein SRL2020130_08870 [Mycobacterium kiyosense]GLB95372.1 hypothetical protein SRL2020226_21480 [Mycobacterium kiyosense]
MTTLQNWINQTPSGSDLVAPIKARACHALHTVLRTKPDRPAGGARLMERGAERC